MKRCIKWISIACVALLVSRVALQFFIPKPDLLAHFSFSRAVYDDEHRLLRLTLSDDGKYRLFTPLSSVAPSLVEATLLQEDQYFWWHLGVNPWSMTRAMWHTYLLKTRRIGASTITMQVARLRFKLDSKHISGKFLQVFRAWQLELHYSKAEILEAYLNLAPYGGNIEGVGAASYLYFNKSPAKLTVPDALTLAVIPQNPTSRAPNNAIQLQEVRYKLFTRWLKNHPADKNKTAIMQLPIALQRIKSAPFLAPHFVNHVLNDTTIDKKEITSSLHAPLQRLIESVTKQYLARKTALGVHNAAVMVVDTRDMRVKALLGSADFFSNQISGQINGTEIKRSPGSTLKPFIYGLALDQGLIHPSTVLKDVPRSFGNYNPENFDYDFVGPIKASDALVLSRNIPAVFLAEQLHPSLYTLLQQANVAELKSELYYGLALVLGGAELTMQELVALYAMLANQGYFKPLVYADHISSRNIKRLLSPEASFLVLDMLSATSPITEENTSHLPKPLAWKTGTSSGFRDAWTLGIAGPYVIAVWIGNFDNQSNPAFVGKEIAAPLFFAIAQAMQTQMHTLRLPDTDTRNLNLTKIEVCKASGMLLTPYCKETEKTWFIPGKSPIKTDTIYREVAVNAKTGLRTCRIDNNTRFEIYEFWPSDLLTIFKNAGIQRKIPPNFDDTCEVKMNSLKGFSPQIISPRTQLNYITRLNDKAQNQVPFTAVVDADVKNLHWFLNETYLGKTERHKAFYWSLQPGKYVVRVVDDYGRSDVQAIKVVVEK